MHEARIYFFGLNIAFWYIACSDIHATKYCEGHETFGENDQKYGRWLATFL